MLNLNIRPFQIKDREEMQRISWQIQEWEKQYYPERALSKEIIAQHVDNLIKSVESNQGVILIAEVDKKVVGYAVGVHEKGFLNTHDTFYVTDMGVDQQYRGQRIGKKFLGELEKIAKEKFGLKKMKIGVICGNEGAERLYRNVGYVPYELELVKNI